MANDDNQDNPDLMSPNDVPPEEQEDIQRSLAEEQGEEDKDDRQEEPV